MGLKKIILETIKEYSVSYMGGFEAIPDDQYENLAEAIEENIQYPDDFDEEE